MKTKTNKISIRNAVIKKIIKTIKKCERFLFISYIDPDALGSMLALGLVLKRLNKEVYFYLPDDDARRIEYMQGIIDYNGIIPVYDYQTISDGLEFDCIVLNDTANRKVIPHYKKIEYIFEEGCVDIIETDHHFGTDSDKIAPSSIALFEKANANCEIITKILYKMNNDAEIKETIDGDTVFKRNILLSLLTGIISDTQFGKYLVNKHQYNIFMKFLSIRLELATLEKVKYFKTPKDIYQYLIEVSKENAACVEELDKYIEKRDRLYVLNIAESGPLKGDIPSYCASCRDVDISDISDVIANKLPEMHGNIGSLILEKELEGEMVYYIKLRRSMSFNAFDLRTLEEHFKSAFSDLYLGGGGHPGAVSFRVKKSSPADFSNKINKVFDKIIY
jgi:nanoRNase/pAp phosphatase (c-di-AMP/oligoRNAs hydrolase)